MTGREFLVTLWQYFYCSDYFICLEASYFCRIPFATVGDYLLCNVETYLKLFYLWISGFCSIFIPVRYWDLDSFFNMYRSNFPAPLVKEAVFSPMYIFGTFVKVSCCACVLLFLGPLFHYVSLNIHVSMALVLCLLHLRSSFTALLSS